MAKKKLRQAEIDAIAKKLAEKLPKESFAQKRKRIREIEKKALSRLQQPSRSQDMTGFLD